MLLRYYYERTGGGDSPEASDDLVVEYRDSLGVWHELQRHLGSGADMTQFEEVVTTLPAGAYYSGFRVRFRCSGNTGNYDDWFIDDVFVGYPSNYDVLVTPYQQSQYGVGGLAVSYPIVIHNRGVQQDVYDLGAAGNDWPVTFWDAAGTMQITSTTPIASGDSAQFMLKVAIPVEAPPHDSDMAMITATSEGDANMASTVSVLTKTYGAPVPFPMYEPFADAQLSNNYWFINAGATVSTEATGMPTPPYSLCLDGDDDTATTRIVNIAGQEGVVLSYYYEAGGPGDVPEAGDKLTFQYKNAAGDWVTINEHVGNGIAMNEFQYVSLALPPEAIHSSFQLRLASIGGTAGQDEWFVDDIRIDFPPQLAVVPGAIEKTVGLDDSTTANLIVGNSGQGGLTYSANVVQMVGRADFVLQAAAKGLAEPAHGDYPPEFYATDDVKGVDNPGIGRAVTRNIGGPDAFGYVWVDSDEGIPEYGYDWIDVSAVGTDIVGQLADDIGVGPFDIGFDFSFYGNIYNQFYFGSNGIIGFASTNMKSRVKTPLPTATTPNDIICLLWDDLDVTNANNPGAHVYIHTDGQRCVIQLVNYPEYRADPGDVMTAEFILYADGAIKLQYQSFGAGFDTQSGTVGIENQDGTDGLEVAYATNYLHDNLAVTFIKPYQWLSLNKYAGQVGPGSADTVVCTLASGTLEEGVYQASIVVHSNDPLQTLLTVPVQMTVTTAPQWLCGDVDGSGTAADVADLVYLVTFMFNQGPPPPVMQAADMDASGGDPDIADLVYLTSYMFAGGPLPDCGQ